MSSILDLWDHLTTDVGCPWRGMLCSHRSVHCTGSAELQRQRRVTRGWARQLKVKPASQREGALHNWQDGEEIKNVGYAHIRPFSILTFFFFFFFFGLFLPFFFFFSICLFVPLRRRLVTYRSLSLVGGDPYRLPADTCESLLAC